MSAIMGPPYAVPLPRTVRGQVGKFMKAGQEAVETYREEHHQSTHVAVRRNMKSWVNGAQHAIFCDAHPPVRNLCTRWLQYRTQGGIYENAVFSGGGWASFDEDLCAAHGRARRGGRAGPGEGESEESAFVVGLGTKRACTHSLSASQLLALL